MSSNLSKLVEGDKFNTVKYMSPAVFNDILRRMNEHGIGEVFTPWMWALLEDEQHKTMADTFIQNNRASSGGKMNKYLEWMMTSYTTVMDAQGTY